MIKSKKLSKNKAIKHGFFNSNGGVSKNIYKSLNCGPGSNDNGANVKKNLNIVRKRISKSSQNIFLLNQIHSNKFVFIDNKYKSKIKPKADAIITDQINLPIAVLTADCVPILMFDKKRKMIAAVHAGWRGAYKNIAQKVIKFMFAKGCTKENLIVAIGPCISMKNYEVKKKFKNNFTNKKKENQFFFKNHKNKIFFNLGNYIKNQVKLNQIRNIDQLNIDTFNKKNNFFSARRSLKYNHNDYGRNISIIVIN